MRGMQGANIGDEEEDDESVSTMTDSLANSDRLDFNEKMSNLCYNDLGNNTDLSAGNSDSQYSGPGIIQGGSTSSMNVLCSYTGTGTGTGGSAYTEDTGDTTNSGFEGGEKREGTV